MDPLWSTDGSFQTVIQAESKKESNTSRSARKRPGATRWLTDGIELEHNMYKICDEAKEIGPNPTPRKADSLNKLGMNLRDRILEFQKRGTRYMGILTEQVPDPPDRTPSPDDEPENVELGLPSSHCQPGRCGFSDGAVIYAEKSAGGSADFSAPRVRAFPRSPADVPAFVCGYSRVCMRFL
ncbi:hypothetical protein FS749_001112 [Ceratobasidium sp. UAMH 11750]|nr:hypothetical protein FS749_001112 [Ceratobasidium sp. UAMH 11750]